MKNRPTNCSPDSHYQSCILKLLSISIAFVLLPFFSSSQSLIVGIPSADVAPKGELELTHESQFYTEGNPRKWNSFNILCYGLGNQTEITTTLNNLNNLDNNKLALGFGLKRYFSLSKNKDIDLRMTTGGNMLFSLFQSDIGGWVYSHLSTRIPRLQTRLTAGFSYGSHHNFGYRLITAEVGQKPFKQNLTPFCFIGGIEQPVYGNWSVIADWYSGTHNLADFIPALQYKIGHQVFIAGYKFPNPGSGGQEAFIFECMITIPGFKVNNPEGSVPKS